VDEVAVEDEGHVIEEERCEGFKRGGFVVISMTEPDEQL